MRALPALIFAAFFSAAPVIGADTAPPSDSQLQAAYCAGMHEARQADIGDVCHEASAGWENWCSDDIRGESRDLAALVDDQSIYKPGVGAAIAAGQEAYHQCFREAGSDAGLAQAAECRKHYTGAQLTACMESAPAEPSCERLRRCDQ